jgi:hypothetical protein
MPSIAEYSIEGGRGSAGVSDDMSRGTLRQWPP